MSHYCRTSGTSPVCVVCGEKLQATVFVRNEVGELVIYKKPKVKPEPGKVILSNHRCDFTGTTGKCLICEKPLTEYLKDRERYYFNGLPPDLVERAKELYPTPGTRKPKPRKVLADKPVKIKPKRLVRTTPKGQLAVINVKDYLANSPQSVRQQVFQRDNYRCVYCKGEDLLTIDHIKPLSAGGKKNCKSNLQVLCYPCNQKKGDQYPYEPKM